MSENEVSVRELVTRIATHLAGWSVTDPPLPEEDTVEPVVSLNGPQGAWLTVRAAGTFKATLSPEDRVEIRCGWPRASDGALFDHHCANSFITCGVRRGASEIARDIARRLLPAYIPEYEAAIEERDVYEARLAQMTRDTEIITAAVNARPRRVPGWIETDDALFILSLGGDIRVNLMHLTLDQVLAVIELLGLGKAA